MYAIETIIVLVTVYFAPALAIRPSLLAKPETLVAIPFVSVLVVFLLQACLAWSNLYTPAVVQVLMFSIALTAMLRLWRSSSQPSHTGNWSQFSSLALILGLALCLYFSSMLFLYGFDKDDEIYSWNMWAVQHFLGEGIDFSYTLAPYPQLFPKLLSFCYMTLGNIESQTAVKTALIVFPFTFFVSVGLAPGRQEKKFLLFFVILSMFLLRDIDLKKIFDDGMPDTMSSVAVLVSIFMLQLYREQRQLIGFLWLSVACATVGALSKQPALAWALFSLPTILLVDVLRKQDKWREVLPGFIPAVCSIVWLMNEGRGFQNNDGVLTRSFNDRGPVEQLYFSINEYLLQEPAIAALVFLAIVSVLRARRGIEILVFFALPSMMGWFLFASYDLRAGLPSLLAFALLIALGNYGLGSKKKLPDLPPNPLPRYGVWIIVMLALGVSLQNTVSDIQKHMDEHQSYVPGFSQRNNLERMFPDDSQIVFDRIRSNPDARLWAPTNYVYGLFYGYTDVSRPRYSTNGYTEKDLIEELRNTGRNFATNSGKIPVGPGGKVLDKLATETCPQLFRPIAKSVKKFDVTVYQIDSDLLKTNYCDP